MCFATGERGISSSRELARGLLTAVDFAPYEVVSRTAAKVLRGAWISLGWKRKEFSLLLSVRRSHCIQPLAAAKWRLQILETSSFSFGYALSPVES